MLLWFPMPYPGESLYSVVARYHACSGNYMVCDSMGQLFGDKRQASSYLIPYRLGYLAQQTEPLSLDFKTLLHEFTLYDYYLLFSGQKNRNGVEETLRTNSKKSYHALLGAYGRQDAPQFLRFCPQCMAEEREKYGEAYWHNLHQAPGMLCCEKHGCLLVDSGIPTVAHATQNYTTLESITLFQIPTGNDATVKRAKEISRDIAYLWENRQRIRAQWERFGESFADSYLALATEKGFATQGGSVHRQRLLDAIQNRFGRELLEALDASVTGNKPWPITMCRHGKRIQSPVKNILMAELLCGDMKTFLEYEEELKENPRPKKAYSYSRVTDLKQLTPYRERWENLIAENPQATRNALIQLAPSVHLWLSRHDSEWLMSHYPPPCKRGGSITPYDWEQRDKECLRQVKVLYKKWREEQGKPCRITRTRFYHELGIASTLSERLPQSMKLIDSCVESDREWDRRRMKWAIQEMIKNDEPLIMWKVIRKAGICEKRRKECEIALKNSGWLNGREGILQEVSGNVL